ncbi:CAP domain-containing protein [Jeotgalibacillus sp. JSM ZJ347]|uniref:CAP domain-containing protein n=1 Tax=Jeotgalibacillus sp. JSM ZJ347 TaxID=3342117 RepID=UPI0035A89E14
MRKLLLLIVIAFGLFLSKPMWEDQIPESVNLSAVSDLSDRATAAFEGGGIQNAWESLLESMTDFIIEIDEIIQDAPELSAENETVAVERPDLSVPSEKLFAIHNIELGQTKSDVEAAAGQASRSSMNEFGVNWHAYHEQYQNFFMVSYNGDNEVNGLFTNQDLISSSLPLKMGSTRDEVRAELGTPLSSLKKGFVRYELQDDGEYDLFSFDGTYITVFYDQHENNTVTALQVVSKDLEDQRDALYAEPSAELEEGFKYQLFDVTNAARVMHGLNTLKWDEAVSETARKHSTDMAENRFFSHDNLDGESPFDRMDTDGIQYNVAGENLAYGQYSAIFAHEGLMNSLGHRENILKPEYGYLGVGVDFNTENQPFFTELFFNN